ncbi:MAG TPA: endolytic transglycosylase MltG [Casimicrobiaceae bacterium]|nr:endolytic transglycosylase MltG [Casimicrobiaceae bacterium]
MRRGIRLLLAFLLIALVAVGAAAAYARWWLAQALPVPAQGFTFDVRPGASLRSVANDLELAGVLRDPRVLVALARWKGVDRSIKAGNYEVPAGTTLPELLARLTEGDVTQSGLTIIEGSTFADLKRALAQNPRVAKTVLELPDAELMARLGAQEKVAEGWFFPDTYFFSSGSTDVALLRRAHELMRRHLDASWAKRAPDLPLKTPYEALILASIVEKETGRPADRPLVASVFVNRLRLGMPLQTDPTVIYGIGERFDGNLHKRDLTTDTAYNTYTRAGLPPSPIALPGQASLDAVVNPPRTEYLYFVARGDGSSEFSKSLADHTRAVARFQKGGR